MANRHAHKKLRAEVRARMTATGDCYQRALAHVQSNRRASNNPRTDLVPFSYFGVPAALATIEMHGMAVAVVVPSSKLWGRGYPQASPVPLMRAAMRPCGAA
jgi:hypothetical protein